MTQEFDFTIVTRAGLTQQEFAYLAGVSRATANMWIRGKMKPHRYLQTKAARVMGALERAVEESLLPVPSSVKTPDRAEAIKLAFRQAFQQTARQETIPQ